MVPLRVLTNGRIHELNADDFSNGITDLCEKHREQNRALAFAFLIYDFCNPQIIKVLNDIDYWNALNIISGKWLSIYYIHSSDKNFGEDLTAASKIETRGMHPIRTNEPFCHTLPMLKRYLALDNDVSLPSILFFQVEDGLVSDYFLVELSEESIEKSFIEFKNHINAAVERLKMVAPENYDNSQPIFNSLKEGVESTKFRKALFRNVQKFPVGMLLSWLGKLEG